MTPTVEGAGVELHYEERGSGPSVLIVHGIAADAGAVSQLAEQLAASARVISYDRRGYGSSGEPEPYLRTTVQEQAEDAAALLRATGGEPTLVVGDGLGALVAIDLLSRHDALVRAAVLVDAPAFALVPEANEELAAERLVLEQALREASPREAVETWLARHGRPAPGASEACSPHAFFADYGALASLPLTRRDLLAASGPAVVLDGPKTSPLVRSAGDALVRLLPNARRESDGDVIGAVRSLL